MFDGRNFEWSQEAVVVSNEMYQNGATAYEIREYLLPFVKKALAEEYDRGYSTCMDTEVDEAENRGYDRGYGIGRDSGFDAGYYSGYDSGYDAGQDY